MEVVARFRKKGGTVLLTTHNMEEAERCAIASPSSINGHLIALGTPKELIAKARSAEHHRIHQPIRRLAAGGDSRLTGLSRLQPALETRWQLRVDSLAEAVPQLIDLVEKHGAKLVSLSTHAATLEDLFVSLTGRELRDV